MRSAYACPEIPKIDCLDAALLGNLAAQTVTFDAGEMLFGCLNLAVLSGDC